MGYNTIILEKMGRITVVTLNRPNVLNAVNSEMRTELTSILDDLKKDDENRAVVFTGAGRGFCAGADIREFKQEKDPEIRQKANNFSFEMAEKIYEFEKPTIGAINGLATGDGAQWVLAFDLNVASENAKFGWTATALGLL